MSLSLAERLALVSFLDGLLTKLRADVLGPQAADEMVIGERRPVAFGGKIPAAWVSMPEPATRASVTSPAKFLAWCEEHCPTEVETIRQVRPSFADVVKRSVKERGGWVDKATGELIPVPGVEADKGDPSVRVNLTDDAPAVIGRARADGLIDLTEMLALPSGEAPDAS